MAFAEDLLEQSHHLAHRDTGTAKQASLRRAVSTAYYALFHLLIDDAVGHWAVERQRGVLARTFDHSKMRGVCDDLLKVVRSGRIVPPELVHVARTFVTLQQHRHTADYDNTIEWSSSDLVEVLELASGAFDAWRVIRGQDVAQDFLLDLFLPKRVR
jgi:uncharacterized protein (UPF0332 family)